MKKLPGFNVILCLIIGLFFVENSGFSSPFNDKFYTLYIKGEMTEWVTLLDSAEKSYKKMPNSDILEDIVRAQYGLTAFYIGGKNDDKALKVVESAMSYLDDLESYYPREGWVLALRASFQGFKLIISPFRFFYKGPTVLSMVHKSEELSPTNEDVMFLKANQTFYLPSILGGDQEKGLEYFAALERKLLQYPIQKEKRWFYLLYLTSNAIACNSAQKYDEAIRIYQLILQIEPGYLWVKNELLPQSQKKQENQYLKDRKEQIKP